MLLKLCIRCNYAFSTPPDSFFKYQCLYVSSFEYHYLRIVVFNFLTPSAAKKCQDYYSEIEILKNKHLYTHCACEGISVRRNFCRETHFLTIQKKNLSEQSHEIKPYAKKNKERNILKEFSY